MSAASGNSCRGGRDHQEAQRPPEDPGARFFARGDRRYQPIPRQGRSQFAQAPVVHRGDNRSALRGEGDRQQLLESGPDGRFKDLGRPEASP